MPDRFLRACRLEPVDATPVWFMRQAGRYLPQYRALREKHSLLELCRHPELAVIVTLQPLDVIDLDAAILFSDLLLPFTPMGLDFDFVKGEGPSIANPIRSAADVARLATFDPEALGHVLETIRLLRRELDGRVPLIGFGGAPFTLAVETTSSESATCISPSKPLSKGCGGGASFGSWAGPAGDGAACCDAAGRRLSGRCLLASKGGRDSVAGVPCPLRIRGQSNVIPGLSFSMRRIASSSSAARPTLTPGGVRNQ